ncbi:MAG: hypothetical protein WAO71_00065 [Gallionella sp.]
MLISFRNFASLVLLTQAVTAFAQADTFTSSEAAIAAMFPNEKYVEWVSTEGDWNGDGIKDLAMILSGPDHRLVVLAGVFGGGYFPLSISSSYCDAQKFYNLGAKGGSLFVEGVDKADGDGMASTTLQFRFNKKLNDLELIGMENRWESFQDNSYGRLSVNYPAGLAIEYERVRGNIKATKRSRFAAPQLARLNGFACDTKPY